MWRKRAGRTIRSTRARGGDGPWNEEVDSLEWIDEATGLACLIVRHPLFGNLNGYVGIPKGSSLANREYDGLNVDIHGGLTFGGSKPGWDGLGDDNLYYLGFDTAHAWDLPPAMQAREAAMGLEAFRDNNVHYRSLGWVRAEVTSLAQQLAALI